MKIDVKSLTYKVADKTILNNISFSTGQNKLVGILGPNGSGKTTIIKHLCRILPSKGNVFIDNVDISDMEHRLFYQTVGILTQFSTGIDPGLMVEDSILMGRYPYKKLFSVYDSHDKKIANDLMLKLGLINLKNRQLGSLSGGELQRVMMSKVLASEPKIILLDEPTNHLDIKYKIEFMQILKNFDGLVIISLHDLSLAAKFCDDILLIKNGTLVDFGPPREILSEKLLKTVYDIDYRILKEPEFIIYY